MKIQWNWKMIILALLITGVLLISASPVTALTVREENYQGVQDSFSLIEQLNGTAMTSAEFMEAVWPDVYDRISPEYKEKLSLLSHSWELTEGDISRGGLFLTSDMDSSERREERLTMMGALSNLEITSLEYMAIIQPEFYLTMSEEVRLSLAAEYRPNKAPPQNFIREGETRWYSTNISENITLLTLRLWWDNPADRENNLSITVYSPDHAVFGPFTNTTAGADTRKVLLETTISREGGIAEGEWWYCVQGVMVNGSQTYTL